jgi:hypothetical protein
VTSSQPIIDSTGVTSSSYAIKISGYKISSSPCEMHTFYLTTIQCFTQEGNPYVAIGIIYIRLVRVI